MLILSSVCDNTNGVDFNSPVVAIIQMISYKAQLIKHQLWLPSYWLYLISTFPSSLNKIIIKLNNVNNHNYFDLFLKKL